MLSWESWNWSENILIIRALFTEDVSTGSMFHGTKGDSMFVVSFEITLRTQTLHDKTYLN